MEKLLKMWETRAAVSRLQKCTDTVIIVEGTSHRLQYSNKQVNFIVHFQFHPNYISSASSILQIEVLVSYQLHHGIFLFR